MRYHDAWRAQRFYRDPHHGKLMGVCAGVADHFGCDATLIRILAIIALFWFGALTLVAYLILGFMLPARSATPCVGDIDEEYRRGARHSADGTFRDMRHRHREPDMKLQRMEGYVTSSRYDLDRQFRDLEH